MSLSTCIMIFSATRLSTVGNIKPKGAEHCVREIAVKWAGSDIPWSLTPANSTGSFDKPNL